MFANAPKPPYYAVIFTSLRNEGDLGYKDMSDKIETMAKNQPGYLGMESARNEIGITVSYWKDMESIQAWGAHPIHQEAKALGMKRWYKSYTSMIAEVERFHVKR